MSDSLLVISSGRAVRLALSDGDLTVGSAPGCELRLEGEGIAPRHAVIRRREDRLWIESLGGELRVADRRPSALELRPGLEVEVGSARLLLVRDEAEPSYRLSKTAAQVTFDTLSQADPARAVRYQRRFQLLMEMARTAGSVGHEGVLEKLMDLVDRGLQPERTALVRLEPEGRLRFEAARHARSTDPWRDLQVSGTVLRRVIERRAAFIAADAGAAAPLATANSITTEGIRSVICVPFLWPGQLPGALYADHRGDARHFDEDDLDFLLMLSQLATVALQNARDYELVSDELRSLRASQEEPTPLVGDSPPMQRLRDLVARVSRSSQPVLVVGERGTGKELVARAIHERSGRGAFVAVNCAAIPEALTESAFFGHERGAFTGAERAHRGYFEQATGGTLFLDEIGDLRPTAQAAILRALQEGEIRKVGSLEPVAVDVRVISATNRDLEQDRTGEPFRPDLLDRLNVLRIEVPPLRERTEDIQRLAAHFVGDRVRRIAATALRLFCDYAWPGNVRELRNVIERAIVLGDGETIWPEDLPPAIREGKPGHYHLMSLDAVVKDQIVRALRHTAGNVSRAAKILGIGRVTLHARLTVYGLDPGDFK